MKRSAKTISVMGTGTAEAAPDLLRLSIGVECRLEQAAAAYGAAGEAAAAITAALRDLGVDGADIATAGLNVRAEISWQDGQGQVIAGYLASSFLAVRIRQLAAAADMIAAAVAAGGDAVRLHGLELGFADPAAVEARAREAAWQEALAKARHYAALAGARLGAVVSVAEPAQPPGPVPLAAVQRVAATDALTVEAGSASVAASVVGVWELLD